MGQLTISMVIFNSKLLNYQRVSKIDFNEDISSNIDFMIWTYLHIYI